VRFWVDLAQKVYFGGWEAKTHEQLVNCITLKSMLHLKNNFVLLN